jgi:hypothetical protein
MNPKRILRALVGLALVALFAWGCVDAMSDPDWVPDLTSWMALGFVIALACLAALLALVNRFEELVAIAPPVRDAGALGALRGGLVDCALLVFVLAVAGFICLSLAIAISEGKPPIAWGRVGGTLTDWVVYVLLLLPLSLGAIALAVGSLVSRRATRQ